MKNFQKFIDPKTTVNSFTGGSFDKKMNDLEAKYTDGQTGHQINQSFDKKMYGSTPQAENK